MKGKCIRHSYKTGPQDNHLQRRKSSPKAFISLALRRILPLTDSPELFIENSLFQIAGSD